MTYRLIRLAPGSYDLELDCAIIASVVRETSRAHGPVSWFAELLDEAGRRPAPFTDAVHEFGTLMRFRRSSAAQLQADRGNPAT